MYLIENKLYKEDVQTIKIRNELEWQSLYPIKKGINHTLIILRMGKSNEEDG